jgi:hypothetical protein
MQGPKIREDERCFVRLNAASKETGVAVEILEEAVFKKVIPPEGIRHLGRHVVLVDLGEVRQFKVRGRSEVMAI